MKKLVFAKFFSAGVFLTAIAVFSLYSCKSDDDSGDGNSFSCDNYWDRVNLNSVCDLGFPDSFTFDSPPQAGATTICIGNVLKNNIPDYNGRILITKTPSNENAIDAYEAHKSLISPSNDLQDFDAGGDRGLVVQIAGTQQFNYAAVKGKFFVQYSSYVAPDIQPCLTKANHDAYMRAVVAKL